MEVFIREKNCATCTFANKEKPNFICGDAIANDIGLKTNFSVCKLSYFANEENCPLKSLEQHDAEIRADERNCIYDEMPKVLADSIIEITENLDKLEFYDLEKIARKFEQKLTELEKTSQGKGEKDE